MNDRHGSVSLRTLALLLAVLLPIAVLTLNPDWLSQLTYAVEVGQAQVAEEKLAVASDLSQAFRQVAKAVRPSVVRITSVRKIQPSGDAAQQFRGQIPDELRDFFGGDSFERYFDFQSPQPQEQRGLGSGVIVTEDGYILTNYHVAGDADEVDVALSDHREFRAKIVGGDKATDIAVLKIEAKNLKPAKLGESQNMEVGAWVLAVGSPFGLEQTVTAGIVSATGRANVGITDYEDFIQTDAAINPGNSGGPLLNLRGEVIGINTAIASRTGGYMGIGFAIPSEMAQHVMQSIIDQGFVTRGRLGALIQDLNQDLAQSFNYDSTQGVLISDVLPDSPAAEAGLKSGDIVTAYNGDATPSASILRNAVAGTKPGTKATLTVFRDGKSQQVEVTIDQLDQRAVEARSNSDAKSSNDYGMAIHELTPEIVQQLDLGNNITGVVVVNVERGSAAAESGVERGDVIVAVGDQKVESVSDFKQAIGEKKEDEGLRLQIIREGLRRFVILKD